MKKFFAVTLILAGLLLSGCETIRFAPTEQQKQNAWLHNETTALVGRKAIEEDTSESLKSLSRLSQLQSKAFVSYYGLPKEFPVVESDADILTESNFQLANTALSESTDRPDIFDLADSTLELAIGISALLGGVYGTRVVRFLKQTREKSEALKEIIEGNELFKKQNTSAVAAFKEAQQAQSLQTRQIVTQMKS